MNEMFDQGFLQRKRRPHLQGGWGGGENDWTASKYTKSLQEKKKRT